MNIEKLRNQLCDMMTSYRWVPFLFDAIANKDAKPKMGYKKKELYAKLIGTGKVGKYDKKVLDVFMENFLRRNQNWLMYTLLDMTFYVREYLNSLDLELKEFMQVDKVFQKLDTLRMECYQKAMAEQIQFLPWEHATFALTSKQNGLNIIDIGCGCFPFVKLFVKNNYKGKIGHYVGIDKRELDIETFTNIGEKYKEINLSFYKAEIHHWLDYTVAAFSCDIFFIGNTLHCIPEPEKLLKKILKKYSEIKQLIIIEPNILKQEGLGNAFNYHMFKHAKTGDVDEIIRDFCDKNERTTLTCFEANPQFMVYKISINKC